MTYHCVSGVINHPIKYNHNSYYCHFSFCCHFVFLCAKKYKSYYTSMTQRACCSIWHSSWHFNRLFQWLYLYIRYSYHTYTQSFQLKQLPILDLVRSIVVCQTDTYPSVKLLPEQPKRSVAYFMKTGWQSYRLPMFR